ncbi:MAG: phosphoribosyltransferase [Verrucomicrobiota bacterium]|nr:phosphoribosyltransferase [Verrucomicrobiota bacterium]
MRYASRQEAGCRLAQFLRDRGIEADVVLGLPRGGVVVAAEVARALHRPLEALVVRKIGHPWHREFAVGALAEPDVVLLAEATFAGIPLPREELDRVIAEEKKRLREYRARFHRAKEPALAGKTVLLVDDGLATGATAEAAVLSAKKQGARRVIVAAPTASTNAVERLQRVADAVIAPIIDPEFEAVGQYYESFSQTSDAEVVELLRAGEKEPSSHD